MSELLQLLKDAYVRKASDVHFRSNERTWIRIDGQLTPASPQVYSTQMLNEMFMPVIPDIKKEYFDQGREIDFAWELEGVARFRINIYKDINGLGGCFRILPSEIKNANDLNLEAAILELCTRTKGLILVTGPTGSGKTTTLSALIDYINLLRTDHIITIEDPIEFVHKEKNCLINQRETGAHTKGFSEALRAALREDPDVVMVGEMRDLETTATALEVAETGHLVLSTLHTNNASDTVYRVINQFPKKKQDQIRVSLASSLIGVISQVLIPKASGEGRIAVREIMIMNHAISNLIRENKIYQINNIIQMNRKEGMITLEDAMIERIQAGDINVIEAMEHAPDPGQFKKVLTSRGIL